VPNILLEAMKAELSAASPTLTDNADLLRGVLAGCGDCIKILDLEGRLQFMSEGGKRVMEVDDFSVLKGCPWPDFWEGPGNADAKAALREAAEGRTGRFRGPAKTAKGNERHWDVQVSPIFGGDGKPSQLLSISKDVTEEWNAAEQNRQHLERQEFLTKELQHRVKNTIATIIAIANQTFKDAAHQSPREAFQTRLITLNRAHDILTASNWGRSPLRDVLDAALAPYNFDEARVHIGGPEVMLEPKQALALALAANELTTNAMKYGALSNANGTVDITWTIGNSEDQRPTLHFTWQEKDGPPVSPPSRTGFGTRVIKNLLADDFNGDVALAYEPGGLTLKLDARV
jgi:two-component sensor histidine kinase